MPLTKLYIGFRGAKVVILFELTKYLVDKYSVNSCFIAFFLFLFLFYSLVRQSIDVLYWILSLEQAAYDGFPCS